MMESSKRTLECVSCVPDESSNKNPSHERELKRINRTGQMVILTCMYVVTISARPKF